MCDFWWNFSRTLTAILRKVEGTWKQYSKGTLERMERLTVGERHRKQVTSFPIYKEKPWERGWEADSWKYTLYLISSPGSVQARVRSGYDISKSPRPFPTSWDRCPEWFNYTVIFQLSSSFIFLQINWWGTSSSSRLKTRNSWKNLSNKQNNRHIQR